MDTMFLYVVGALVILAQQAYALIGRVWERT